MAWGLIARGIIGGAKIGGRLIGAGAGKVAGPVARVALKTVPVVGAAATAYQVGKELTKPAQKKISASTLPMPPFVPQGTGGGQLVPVQPGGIITRTKEKFKGPGGKLQVPGFGPDVPDYLKQFSLDDSYLTVMYRAPKGYVVLKDADGRPIPVNKIIAKQMGLWKPGKKPLLSIRDTNALRRASTAINKLKNATKKAKAIANFKG